MLVAVSLLICWFDRLGGEHDNWTAKEWGEKNEQRRRRDLTTIRYEEKAVKEHHSANEYKLIMCNLCILNLTPSSRSKRDRDRVFAHSGKEPSPLPAFACFCLCFVLFAQIPRWLSIVDVTRAFYVTHCCVFGANLSLHSSKLHTETHTLQNTIYQRWTLDSGKVHNL